jgi:uncharacterized membrane protein
MPWARTAFSRISHNSEVLFGLLFFTFGLAFVIITPPIYSVDESAHFYRTYQVSRLHLVADNVGNESGGDVPASMTGIVREVIEQHTKDFSLADTRKLATIQLNEKIKDRVEFTNVTIYPALNYIPQAMGFRIAGLFTDSVLALLYAARLYNLIFLGACLIISLRLIPHGKASLFALGLLPMTLYAGASLSADVFVLASVSLFAAYLFRLLNQHTSITTSQWCILGGLVFAVALSKHTYIILTLPVLALAFKHRRLNLPVLGKTIAVLVVGFLGLLLWLFVIRNLHTTPTALQSTVGIYPEPAEQARFILGHPFSFLKVLLESLTTDKIALSFFGQFGISDISVPTWAMLLSWLMLFLSFGYPGGSMDAARLSKRLALLFVGAGMLNVMAILAGLYVLWSNPKQPSIGMLHGRYFIPILIMLVPALVGRYSHTLRWRFLVSGIFLVLCASIAAIFEHFYEVF